jgi:lipopolysaccharide export system protein LptA
MRFVVACLCALACAGAHAAPATKGGDSTAFLPGGNAKAPISIEADHLDYFEKEGKAVYTGRVVVVQGDTKLTCSKLTIFMEKSATNPANPPAPTPSASPDATAPAAGNAAANSSVKHMDCAGPVSVLSKTQTATADNGSYDKAHSNIVLIGHVVMSDGRNVTKGDRLVYDLTSGQATVQGGGSRVTGLFLPGSDPAGAANASNGAKKK